jgi:hypothetical protein
MATLFGMALGGRMSGKVFDLAGSYHAAFVNGIGWNLLNLSIALFLLARVRGRKASPVATVQGRGQRRSASRWSWNDGTWTFYPLN